MKSDPEKVLIIGSGIGGLSSAIILAKLGYDVTVLEKNRHPGGLLRSYTRNGLECEVGVHYLGSLDHGQVLRKFFDYLGVTEDIPVSRMGQDGIIDRYFFDSPKTHPPQFDLPEGLDAFKENLKAAFPDEHAVIETIAGSISDAARQLHGLELFNTENDFSLLDQAEPYGEILDQLGCSPGLRSVLAIASSWVGVPLADCPAYYHNMALASYVSSSWRLEQSGSDMADVLAARLKKLGGKLITGAEVSKLRVHSRVVTGVQLESGEELTAGLVIGAVHPKVILAMLPEGAVKPSYRNRISKLKDTHSVFSVHAELDAQAHPEIPYNLFKIDTDQAGNVPDLRYYQIRKGDKEGVNLLSILTSGRDELWEPWQKSRSGRREKKYYAVKERLAMELIREAETVLGPLKGMKIVDTYTPLTIRDWVNSPEGSAYGVLRSSSQVLATALLNRTAVKGLYLAGQNVLAPGVIGTIMGSFSTVKQILGADQFHKRISF